MKLYPIIRTDSSQPDLPGISLCTTHTSHMALPKAGKGSNILNSSLCLAQSWYTAHIGSTLASGSTLVPNTGLHMFKDQKRDLFYGKKQKFGVRQI